MKAPNNSMQPTALRAAADAERWPVQMSGTEDPPGSRWDFGYVPVAMLIAAFLLTLIPSPPCIMLGFVCLLFGFIVAGCICWSARAHGRRISIATWWAIALSVLFPVCVLLRRNL